MSTPGVPAGGCLSSVSRSTCSTEAEDMFLDADVTVPPEWGGYRVRPERIEFWQGRTSRMHDRLVYERDGDGWRTQRLAP